MAEFKPWLQAHWPRVRQALLAGDYMPMAVRQVEIPKPQGGVRTLGIPTVLDRLIQQALNQVMQALFDPEFCLSSYGFRPGRNSHQAVQAAQSYVAGGKRWVVDLGLEKVRAWRSATNGHGPWWNSAASHMNAAYAKSLPDW